MRSKTFLVAILISNFAFAQVSFEGAVYENSQHSFSEEIIETNTHEYIITGGTSPFMHNHYPHLIKLDSIGNFLWQRPVPYVSYAYRVLQLEDGNYLIASPGITVSQTQFDRQNITFSSLDTAANLYWQRGISDTMYNFYFRDIVKDISGGFVFVGRKDSANRSSSMITKYDKTGNIVFQKSYLRHVAQSSPYAYYGPYDFVQLVQHTDSTFYVLAAVDGAPAIIHLDALGDSLASWPVPDQLQAGEEDIILDFKISDNRLIALLNTVNTTSGYQYVKTFYSTLEINTTTFIQHLTIRINSFLPSDNNSKIGLGLCNNNFGSQNAYIEKRDSNENLMWSHCTNTSYLIFPDYFSLNYSSDNGVLFTGRIDSLNSGQYESIYYLKLDSEGHLSTNISLPNDINSFVVYPNPANEKLFIRTDAEIKEIVILDILGKEIITQRNSLEVDIRTLRPGIYFVEMKTTDGAVTKKFIKK